MSNSDRPLSPHISVYRWPITMALSILHRATGLANAVGLVVLAAWLVALAAGADDYSRFVGLIKSVPGQILLIAWTFSFFYHFANGIRHLFWDTGYGFERHQANASAWFVLVLAASVTTGLWIVAS